jgi:thioredoxin-related protein
MKKSISILVLAVFIFLSGCKKDDQIVAYAEGQGHITGSTDNGINFNIEGRRAYFNLYRAGSSPANGDKSDLFIYAHIDTVISRHFSIYLGTFEDKPGKYYLDEQSGADVNSSNFIEQGSPQVSYYLYNTPGLRSYVNITRVDGNYVEGDYVVRLSLSGNSTGPVVIVQGTFKGNCRVS